MSKQEILRKLLQQAQAGNAVEIGHSQQRLGAKATAIAGAGLPVPFEFGHSYRWQAFAPYEVRFPDKLREVYGSLFRRLPWVEGSSKTRLFKGAMDQLLDDLSARYREEVQTLLRGGDLLWVAAARNLVVDEGLDEILDKFYNGSSYTAAHYVGLTDGTPTFAAGDTISGTHSGWAEVTAYSETNRQDFTPGTVSGQSVDNASNKASFSINSDNTTIGGSFLVTNNTKGGTSGILIGGAAFSAGDKTLDNGDTLNVTVTATASSS